MVFFVLSSQHRQDFLLCWHLPNGIVFVTSFVSIRVFAASFVSTEIPNLSSFDLVVCSFVSTVVSIQILNRSKNVCRSLKFGHFVEIEGWFGGKYSRFAGAYWGIIQKWRHIIFHFFIPLPPMSRSYVPKGSVINNHGKNVLSLLQ